MKKLKKLLDLRAMFDASKYCRTYWNEARVTFTWSFVFLYPIFEFTQRKIRNWTPISIDGVPYLKSNILTPKKSIIFIKFLKILEIACSLTVFLFNYQNLIHFSYLYLIIHFQFPIFTLNQLSSSKVLFFCHFIWVLREIWNT